MFSIGEISRRTGVKVTTIRYYEEMGLLSAPERTTGNQRRYGGAELQTLAFVKHARELGFSIEAISQLIELHHHPDQACKAATDIAQGQLSAVRSKIEQLKALEGELNRIAQSCDGDTISGECHVLASLADHSLCAADH